MPKSRLEQSDVLPGDTKTARARQRRPVPQPSERVYPTYSEEERIAVVTLLVQAGGVTHEGITLARQRLNSNVSTATLTKWMHRYKDRVLAVQPSLAPQPVDFVSTVEKTRNEVATLLNDAFLRYARHINKEDVANKASARDGAVVMGIAYDKLQAMISPYATYNDDFAELDTLLQSIGYTFKEYLSDSIAAAKAKRSIMLSDKPKSLSSSNE